MLQVIIAVVGAVALFFEECFVYVLLQMRMNQSKYLDEKTNRMMDREQW